MHRLLVMTEKASINYSAHLPDLAWCVATGKTREKAEQNMPKAIRFHIEGLIENILPITEPHSNASCSAAP